MPIIPNPGGSVNPNSGMIAESTFQSNTSTDDGVKGHVPAPPAGTPATYVLQADGTWGPGGGGGGGGGVPTISATWSTGGTAKNSTVVAGINLAIVLTTNQPVTVTAVSVGGVALTGTFSVTGSFPTYSVAVASGDVPSAVQTNGGAVSIQGSFNSVEYSVSGGALTINTAVPFSATFTGAYRNSSYPAWTISDTIVTTGTIVSGVISPTIPYSLQVQDQTGGGQSPTIISVFASQTTSLLYPFADSVRVFGTVTGDGLNGAPTGVTININSPISAPTTYAPIIYGYTGTTTPTITAGNIPGNLTSAFASGQSFSIVLGFTGSYWVCTPPLAGVRSYTFTKSGLTTVGTPNTTATQTFAGVTYTLARFDSIDATGAPITVTVS